MRTRRRMHPIASRSSRVGASAAAWTPASLGSALLLWVKADAGTYQERTGASATTAASADADPVGSWLDQSGNGRHLTASADSERPTLKLLAHGRAVRFDGSDDWLLMASTIAFGAGKTLFAAAHVTQTALIKTVISGPTDAWQVRFNADEKVSMIRAGVGVIATSTAAHSTAARSLLAATYDNSNYAFRLNGADNGSGAGSNTVVAANSTVGSQSPGAPTEFFNGDLHELVVANGVLSAANIALVESYLNARWTIY